MGSATTKASVACLLSITAMGCAYGMNGTTQRIAVTSTPTSAQVVLDGEPVGVTPVNVVVPRRAADTLLQIEKDGFRTYEMTLERSASRWLWVDVPLSVVFGWAGYFVQGARTESTVQALGGAAAGFSPVLVALATGAAFAVPGRVTAVLVRGSGGQGGKSRVTEPNREGLVTSESGSRLERHESSTGLGGEWPRGQGWWGVQPLEPPGLSRVASDRRALLERVRELRDLGLAERDDSEHPMAARHQWSGSRREQRTVNVKGTCGGSADGTSVR